MNEQRPSKEKVSRWLVVAGGDGYETHICEGVEAMERKFLEVHFGPPLLAPEYTRGEIEEMESLLGHLRNENHWTSNSDLGRVSYSIRHEDGCVDVIRLTDESPTHEPEAAPVAYHLRRKSDGLDFGLFFPAEAEDESREEYEFTPLYRRPTEPPGALINAVWEIADDSEEDAETGDVTISAAGWHLLMQSLWDCGREHQERLRNLGWEPPSETKEAARCPCWDVWRTHCQGLVDCRANQQGASPETSTSHWTCKHCETVNHCDRTFCVHCDHRRSVSEGESR